MSVLAILALAGVVPLVVACWSRRAVLGGICAVAAAACALAGLARGGEFVVGAYAALVLGTALLAVARAVWTLLDDDPPERDGLT